MIMLKKLELLLPPLPLTFVLCGAIVISDIFIPELSINLAYGNWIACLFFMMSAVFVLPAVFSFIQAKTTVDPRVPEKSKKLVVSGLYKISRNPMYVGFLFFILATGFFYSNIIALVLAVVFVPYMNRFQISLEETQLNKAFGEHYIQYCQRVRRWL